MGNPMEGSIKFRIDLEVFKYDDIEDRNTVVLKDPVSGKYYYLSVYEFRLLKILDGTRTLEQAIEALMSAGHYYAPETAQSIVSKAAQLGLILGTKFSTAQFQTHLKQQWEQSKKAQRFSSVYFMFIPLLNPDKFLEKTLWIARLFANKFTLGVLAAALPGAIYLIISGLPRMQTEYLFFFNWENLLYLWVTLALLKLIHEFAHAYSAKSFGLHVPQMGVAFLIFFPCLFCNTTDAWQLADRKQRMVISAAGILMEGALAIISTYVWYFTDPGVVNSLAFYLMAISFLSTLLFNCNPLMRFDGYFILMDYLRLPNLYTRGSAYLKYLFMNRVLGNSLVPNPASTPREVFIFSVYGISAFLYRIFLYTAIVMGVYYRFDKLLGILLALLAFSLFIVRPLIKGAKSLHAQRTELHPRLVGSLVFAALVASVVAVLLIPISGKSFYPCYVASAEVQKLTIPLQTSVSEVYIREGSGVAKGDLLYRLETAPLQLSLLQKEMQLQSLKKEMKFLLLDDKRRDKAGGKEVEIAQLEVEIKRIKKDLRTAQSGIVAPFDGVVTRLDYRVQDGFQPGEGTVVGEVESATDCVVHTLIPSKDLDKLHIGREARVWFPLGTGLILTGLISEIRPYSEQDLKDSPFSSRFGGEVATEPKGDEHSEVPLEAIYRCSINFSNSGDRIPLGMTGRLVLQSPHQSLLARFMDGLFKNLNKESLL
jgi:putative peptide zinc metalloprotease protein